MAGTVESQEVAARDDAQLRALGIKPELRRTLGFLSNFAIAFSFISVSTGSFGNFGVGLGLGGPAAIFWSWVLVITGQFIVCLGFAELASHFPVAGSIYQWSKRLSNRTLGWFTGWFYFWAQVVTVSAVAVIVGYVIAGFTGGGQEFLDSPSPLGIANMHTFIAADHASDHDHHQRVRRQAAVDPQQHRRCHRDPGHGRLRADPAVLCQSTSPSRSSSTRAGRRRRPAGAICRHSRWACTCRSSSCTGSTRPAPSARRRSTPLARPRAACCRRSDLGSRRPRSSSLAVLLAMPNIPASRSRRASAGGFPIAHDHHREPDRRAFRRHHRRGALPARHPRVCLRLHAGDPGCRDADDVLDESRPASAARQRLGARQPHVQDPGQCGHRGRRTGGPPDPRHRSDRWFRPLDRRDRA